MGSYKRKYHGGSGNSWRSGIVMDRPMGENLVSYDRIPKLCGLWVYHVNTKIIIFPIKIAMRGGNTLFSDTPIWNKQLIEQRRTKLDRSQGSGKKNRTVEIHESSVMCNQFSLVSHGGFPFYVNSMLPFHVFLDWRMCFFRRIYSACQQKSTHVYRSINGFCLQIECPKFWCFIMHTPSCTGTFF